MNELTLHYVNQSDRERTIEEDLRNRQLLDAATNIRTEAAATGTASTDKLVTATRLGKTPTPRPTAVRARAAGR
jgi:hypothetical protein